jgi:hypothetical protein
MKTYTAEQIDQLASAIADPTLSLAAVPNWPQWFRDLAPSEQDRAMRQMMETTQPKLDAALRQLGGTP